MLFKVWGGNYGPKKRRPHFIEPRKDRAVLAGVDARLKQIAFDRLAVLRRYYFRLSNPGRFKTKTAVMKNFLDDLSSGILWPEGIPTTIRHACRSTLYNWDRAYGSGGLAALVPRYKTKLSGGQAKFRPLMEPIEWKFSGSPRRAGKAEFLARLKRRYNGPPLDCPVRLKICYSMKIPTGIKMPLRMRLLKHEISHTGKPELDGLDAFTIGCLIGTVIKDSSQIVQLHSEKNFGWWPQTKILLRPLKG
jgi:hypothetical protein